MNAKIVFTLLARSQLLARILALHALRKAEVALPAAKNQPAVRVRVFGLIEVCVDLEGDTLGHVRSKLEANGVVFSLDKFPFHLVGRVGSTPWLWIWVGH